MEKSSFLPHVNGLRALAIAAVVLYHLDADLCPCGYFGVDAFLLITGFFLFRGELSASRQGIFHYRSYLQKKLWRLLPPVLVLAVPLVLVGAFVLQPDLYKVMLGTLGYSCLGLGNEYVAHSGDYFSPATQDNPLMHLWYVGLTLQLYVLLPLVARLLWRFRMVGFILLALASLSLHLFLEYGEMLDSMVPYVALLMEVLPPYYSLAARVWEPLLALLVLAAPELKAGRLRSLLGATGLVLLAAPLWLCETGSAFALPVLVGTALLLRYGDAGVTGRFLSWTPLQQLGTVSFSLYLVHWPVMALWRYTTFDEVGVDDMLGMVALSVLLAWLLWCGVEKRCAGWGRALQRPGWVALGVLLPLGAFCIWLEENDALRQGLPNAVDEEEMQFSHYILTGRAKAEDLNGFPSRAFQHPPHVAGNDTSVPVSYLLLGDSHAWHLQYGMDKLLRERGGRRGLYLNNSCVPAWNCFMELQGGNARWNRKKGERLLEWLERQPNIRCVIISCYWHLRFAAGSMRDWNLRRIPSAEIRSHMEAGLRETCRRLQAMGKHVVVLRDNPFYPRVCNHVNRYMRRDLLRLEYELPEQTKEQYVEATATEEPFMQSLQRKQLATVLDIAPALELHETYPLRINGRFLYRDTNHLSRFGSERVAELLLDWMQKNGY